MSADRRPDRDRSKFTAETRLSLVEEGLDDLDAKVDTNMDDFRKELHAVQRVLIGILVSLTTAAVLLALNIGLK